MQIVVHNVAQVVVQMRKLTNGVVEIVNGTGTNARFQVAFVTRLVSEFSQSLRLFDNSVACIKSQNLYTL